MASAATAPPFEAFFAEPPSGGRRLCIHTPPRAALRGAVLQLPAFAEEMNKSRRMCALAARALADAGFAVLQIDLLGCGDSSGDFADASWPAWQADLAWALRWLQQRHPTAPLWLWAHRAGALLAAGTMQDLPCHLLLWNPVLQGKAVAQQFLRLRAAAEWASGDGGKAAMAQVRAELAAGRSVEIAGYVLNPGLVQALESAALAPVAGEGRRLVWLEVAGRDVDASLSPAAQLQVPRWQAAGWAVDARAVAGPAFWQTVEIEDAPALVDATVAALTA